MKAINWKSKANSLGLLLMAAFWLGSCKSVRPIDGQVQSNDPTRQSGSPNLGPISAAGSVSKGIVFNVPARNQTSFGLVSTPNTELAAPSTGSSLYAGEYADVSSTWTDPPQILPQVDNTCLYGDTWSSLPVADPMDPKRETLNAEDSAIVGLNIMLLQLGDNGEPAFKVELPTQFLKPDCRPLNYKMSNFLKDKNYRIVGYYTKIIPYFNYESTKNENGSEIPGARIAVNGESIATSDTFSYEMLRHYHGVSNTFAEDDEIFITFTEELPSRITSIFVSSTPRTECTDRGNVFSMNRCFEKDVMLAFKRVATPTRPSDVPMCVTASLLGAGSDGAGAVQGKCFHNDAWRVIELLPLGSGEIPEVQLKLKNTELCLTSKTPIDSSTDTVDMVFSRCTTAGYPSGSYTGRDIQRFKVKEDPNDGRYMNFYLATRTGETNSTGIDLSPSGPCTGSECDNDPANELFCLTIADNLLTEGAFITATKGACRLLTVQDINSTSMQRLWDGQVALRTTSDYSAYSIDLDTSGFPVRAHWYADIKPIEADWTNYQEESKSSCLPNQFMSAMKSKFQMKDSSGNLNWNRKLMGICQDVMTNSYDPFYKDLPIKALTVDSSSEEACPEDDSAVALTACYRPVEVSTKQEDLFLCPLGMAITGVSMGRVLECGDLPLYRAQDHRNGLCRYRGMKLHCAPLAASPRNSREQEYRFTTAIRELADEDSNDTNAIFNDKLNKAGTPGFNLSQELVHDWSRKALDHDDSVSGRSATNEKKAKRLLMCGAQVRFDFNVPNLSFNTPTDRAVFHDNLNFDHQITPVYCGFKGSRFTLSDLPSGNNNSPQNISSVL